MADTPTKEPLVLVAGDTWAWIRSLADYPATTWTLTYYFRSRQHEFSFSASAQGDDHLVEQLKAATAAYHPGDYDWQAVVDDGTTRATVMRGRVRVLPDPLNTGAGFDGRSHARRVLEALEAVIERRATSDQQSYAIGGRSLQKMRAEELIKFHAEYLSIVRAEDAAAAIAGGHPSPKNVGVRFNDV